MPEVVDIAVIIVVYDKILPGCLASLQTALEHTCAATRVVVVDSASPHLDVATIVLRELPQAHVIVRNRNDGFGVACNEGASRVQARYYFFLNPDTHLHDARMFQTLLSFMERYPRVGIAAPRTRYLDGRIQETCRRFPAWFLPFARRTTFLNSPRGRAYSASFLMDDFDHDNVRLVDWVQGSAFMIRGDVFHELRGFDERYFMYFEDVDLCRQCWERGRPIYYHTGAELTHAYAKDSARVDGVIPGLLSNR
ncbi:glycosyltransferase, partial [Candidatus Uhrbacteria bacterium]|nr:glycosyltransferase [Candidatus Uhrbacteria bacterium]